MARTRRSWTCMVALALLATTRTAAAHDGFLLSSSQILADGDRTLIVANRMGVFVGTAGGPWRWICEEVINGSFFRRWARGGDGTLYATDYRGVSASRDHGCTFSNAPGEITARPSSGVVADPAHPTAAFATTSAGIAVPWNALFVSEDSGQSWQPLFQVDEFLHGLVISADGRTLYTVGFSREAVRDPVPVLHVARERGTALHDFPVKYTMAGLPPYELVPLGVDPADPDTVYLLAVRDSTRALLRVSAITGDAVELLRRESNLHAAGFDGDSLYLASDEGLLRSTGGAPFAPVAGVARAQCVTAGAGGLDVCTWDLAVGSPAAMRRSPGGGDSLSTIFRFTDTVGPVDDCPAGTPAATVCPAAWPSYSPHILGLDQSYFPDGAFPPADDAAATPMAATGCACSVGGAGARSRSARFGLPLALSVLALAIARRRSAVPSRV